MPSRSAWPRSSCAWRAVALTDVPPESFPASRSEEHTSELQSHSDLVCRLLLEKKKTKKIEAIKCIRNNSKLPQKHKLARRRDRQGEDAQVSAKQVKPDGGKTRPTHRDHNHRRS